MTFGKTWALKASLSVHHHLRFTIQDSACSHFTVFINGFVHGRSTMLQLLHMFDECTEDLESGGQIYVIYTDYEKAFDKVPHRRLLNKIFFVQLAHTGSKLD